MAKVTFQSALPRRSMFIDGDAKPSGSTRAPAMASVKATGVSSLTPAAPAQPAPYADWIERIGLTAAEAATLLGVTRQSAHAWSKPGGEAPLHVRQRLALIEHNGLDVARAILSEIDDVP